MQTTQQSQRFDALTGLRFIAVCCVFLYHNRKYWRPSIHPELSRILNELHFGVALFFVLSGFLIAYTYDTKPLASPKSYLRYFLLRCARILPLYWLILTAFYLDPRYGKQQFSALTYSLLHGFSNRHNLDGLNQAWSLNVEMTFYLLAPILCFFKQKHLKYLLLAVSTSFILFWGIGQTWNLINHNPNQFFTPFHFLLQGTFPGRCTEFIAGMLLAGAIQSGNSLLKNLRHKTILASTGIIAITYIIGLFQPTIFLHGYDHPIGMVLSKLILPILISLLLAGLIYEKTYLQDILSHSFVVLLGNASFAFYLIHISYVNLKFKGWHLFPDRNFTLLWVIALLLYKFFEKPIYDYCRKALQPRNKINASPHSNQAQG